MISVLCPVYNEAEYIDQLISFFVNSEPKEKELLILDGGSTDDTLKIVESWANNHDNIVIIHNPAKYVPYALNLGIKSSRGELIVRLDAHTIYQKDYFQKIIETFSITDADIVGGPMIKIGKSDFQKSVAYVTSTIFGVGDSKIHQSNFSGYTDHVYLGAWRRELFGEVGFFDEKLIRNQDDEFSYRARSMGKKIYLNSEIKSFYYPRNNLKLLLKQYFEYGLFKPIVSKKIKSEIKLRHLLPGIFVIYLILGTLIGIIYPIILLPLLIYLILTFLFAFVSNLNFKSKIFCLLIFPTIHFSYGFGYIIGLFRLCLNKFNSKS